MRKNETAEREPLVTFHTGPPSQWPTPPCCTAWRLTWFLSVGSAAPSLRHHRCHRSRAPRAVLRPRRAGGVGTVQSGCDRAEAARVSARISRTVRRGLVHLERGGP